MFSDMSSWKRWLAWKPIWAPVWASCCAASGEVGAQGETTADEPGEVNAPTCRRPDQAAKCFKLDYILLAFGLPKTVTREDTAERCKLCASIGSAEPWDCKEDWDHYEKWTR